MTTYRVRGHGDLKEFVRKRRRAVNGRTVQAALGKALKELTDPIVRDLRASVMAVDSRGVRGGGSKRREGTHLARQKRRPRGGFGLRATVARGAKATVRLAGSAAQMTVWMDNSHMPRSQRNLPSHLNNPKGWRHPTFGRRGKGDWAQQFGEPYFDRVINRYRFRTIQAAKNAVDQAIRELE